MTKKPQGVKRRHTATGFTLFCSPRLDKPLILPDLGSWHVDCREME
ncbi:MAG: hypothetical protein ACOYMG_24105 [Candidatus Methylumidiphilus sp.]